MDLDRYLGFYNGERAHQGYRTKGRTPYPPCMMSADVPEKGGAVAEAEGFAQPSPLS